MRPVFSKAFFRVILLFMPVLVTKPVFTQQKPDYTLLWEISGNGLTKPSYLFGTMHLKDRRIFNFSDSVMKALEACDLFVMETSPDSLWKTYFEQEDQKPLNNPDYLSENAARSANKPKWNDMPVIMDAYLYGIARTLKKQVSGLEPIASYLQQLNVETEEELHDLYGRTDAETNAQPDVLITTYARGNLDEIWDLLSQHKLDALNLESRNRVMEARIRQFVHRQSAFIAVGAAHLPGETGLIMLLSNAGYNVRPVKASFTGVAATYKINYAEMDWLPLTDSIDHYTVNFPVSPVLRNTQTHARSFQAFDMCSGVVFTCTSNVTGKAPEMSTEQYLDSLLDSFLARKKLKLVHKKPLNGNGFSGIEADVSNGAHHAAIRSLFQNNTLYVLTAEHRTRVLPAGAKELFFNSFAAWKPESAAPGNWITYRDTTGAFEVRLPSYPQKIRNEVQEASPAGYPPYILHIFNAVDRENQMNYVVRYNDFPTGTFLSEKETVFSSIVQYAETMGKVIGKPRVIYKDGAEGRTFNLMAQGILMEVRFFVKGNRSYLLLRNHMTGAAPPVTDPFFDSFTFIPPARFTPVPFTFENIDMVMPDQPIALPPEQPDEASFLDDHASFAATNRNSGGMYVIQATTLKKYFRITDIDSMYRGLLREARRENGRLLNEKSFVAGNIRGMEQSTWDSLAGRGQRMRIWAQGEHLYVQSVFADTTELYSQQTDLYFNAVKHKETASGFDLKSSKAALIMQDLQSADTTVYQQALGAIRHYYSFDKDELPVIYKALQRSYADDTLATGVRGQLINELTDLHDDQTIPVLRKLYTDVAGFDALRAGILSSVVAIDPTMYDWYVERLTADRLAPPYTWSLFRPLNDSLSFTASHLDQLLPLLEHKPYRSEILGVIAALLSEESNGRYDHLFLNKGVLITSGCLDHLNEFITDFKTDKQRADYQTIYRYLDIFPKIREVAIADRYTAKVLALDNDLYLSTAALVSRILMGLPCEEAVLSAHLDSLESRYDVLKAFHKVGKLDRIPLQYREHKAFAHLLLHRYLSDLYDYPQRLILLGEETQPDGTYFVFEFTYPEEEVEKTYIGVCGPFNEEPGKLNFEGYNAYSDFEAKQNDWVSQAKGIISKLNEE